MDKNKVTENRHKKIFLKDTRILTCSGNFNSKLFNLGEFFSQVKDFKQFIITYFIIIFISFLDIKIC